MRVRNPTDKEVKLDLRGREYLFPPGAEDDIPDRFAYVIKARGLPLVNVGGDGPASVEEDEPPSDPRALLWYRRAHEVRVALVAVGQDRDVAEAELGLVRETLGDVGNALAQAQAENRKLENDLTSALKRAEAAERERDELVERATAPGAHSLAEDAPPQQEHGRGRPRPR